MSAPGPPAGRLAHLARVLVRHPLRALGVVAVLAVLAGVFGTSVVGLMTSEVGDPHAESQRALDRLTAASGQSPGADDVVLLVDLPARWPDPAAQRTVASLADRLGDVDGVAQVVAPRAGGPGASSLVSRDARQALVTAGLESSADPEPVAGVVQSELGSRSVLVGGEAAVSKDIDDRIARDLTFAETLAFPLLFLLGIWIFRGVVAAVLPLVVGGVAIVLALGAMRLVATQVTLSQYVLNLAIGLGLGLAIDYCLFLVSRYREEVQVHGYGPLAVVRTVVHAGRTVLFSAATVVLALATLMLFPQEFLYSMGIGGVLVTGLAALVSVTLVPAMLVLLGPRVDAWALPAWRRARERESVDVRAGRWYTLARWVMRHAAVVFPVALLASLLLAAPALSTTFGDVDETSLPTTSEPRVVADSIADDFPGGGSTPLVLAVSAPRTDGEAVRALAGRATRAAGTGARLEAAPSYAGRGTWLVRLGVPGSPFASGATSAVRDVRALSGSPSFLVGGQAAAFSDLRSSIAQRLPWALLIVAVAVLLVMLVLTTSLVLAVKTLLLNALNVAMTFGVLVWVFQLGHLEGLLGFTSTGRIDLTQPVLVAIIAFGLSTDYGIFLFDRIMEAHRRGEDDAEAVAYGVGRSGRIISSAALLLCLAIGAFSTSSILFIKQLGVGAAVAVFLDATLVRAVLVPSAMQLMGRANWWAPAALRRLVPAAGGPTPARSRRRLLGPEPTWPWLAPYAALLVATAVIAFVIGTRTGGEEAPRTPAAARPTTTPSAGPSATTAPANGPARRVTTASAAVDRLALPGGATVDVQPVTTTTQGVLVPPADQEVAGWWRDGARIGDPFGSLLLVAHADCRVEDPGPFAGLGDIGAGERFTVGGGSLTRPFEVTGRRVVGRGDLTSVPGVFSPSGAARLTVVTCTGPYDAASGGYQDLAVLTATPAGPVATGED